MRNPLLKFGVFCLLVLLAALLAGVYGVLHDQVTFTISSEYFTTFKFKQFGFQDWGPAQPRTATAIIGFLATWWVGCFAGIVLGLVGFIHRTAGDMFRVVLHSILLTLAVAVAFALVGALYSLITFSPTADCLFPFPIVECGRFRLVGEIHTFGYIGGEIGVVGGMAYQLVVKKRNKTVGEKVIRNRTK